MLKFYYSLAPNPMKVALFLEEAGLPYEAIPVDTRKGEQHASAFTALNPNAKVPVIVDGAATVFDSNAILLYLADKTGQFLPSPQDRGPMLSWLMFVAFGHRAVQRPMRALQAFRARAGALCAEPLRLRRLAALEDRQRAPGRAQLDGRRALHAGGHGGLGLGARAALCAR